MPGSRGGGGGGGGAGGQDPLKIHKNVGSPSNIGLDPLKITKLLSQHKMLGHLNGVLLVG